MSTPKKHLKQAYRHLQKLKEEVSAIGEDHIKNGPIALGVIKIEEGLNETKKAFEQRLNFKK